MRERRNAVGSVGMAALPTCAAAFLNIMICSLIMRRNCIDRAHKKRPALKAGRERKKTDR